MASRNDVTHIRLQNNITFTVSRKPEVKPKLLSMFHFGGGWLVLCVIGTYSSDELLPFLRTLLGNHHQIVSPFPLTACKFA